MNDVDSTRVPVTFSLDGITVWVDAGTTVVEAARVAGIVIPAPCGGRGVCGSCAVRVRSGALSDPDDTELATLMRAPKGVRLACRARIVEPVEIQTMATATRVAAIAPAVAAEHLPLVAGVDLGTTSVAAVIIDSASGAELARASVPNRQQRLGADVLTRISAALAGSAPELQALAEESVLDALSVAAQRAGVTLVGVERLVIAGNTAMVALLCGVDTASLAVHPFTAPTAPHELASSEIRSALGEGADIVLVPAIASFVGGDALAGVVCCGKKDADGASLLVDLGTNAEIVLTCNGTLYAASAAAGPAFEGAGITCGGPAADGAVSLVEIAADGTVGFTVLGGGEPQWFSGSGVVSALSALRRLGHVDRTGLMHASGPLEDRYHVGDGGVAGFEFGSGGGCLTITQLDVRAVQLAKAAIRVGIQSVLATAGCAASDLDEVRVAGAFGFSVHPDDLVELGVLPLETAGSAVRAGNTALDGAAAIALDPEMLKRAQRAASSAVSVELAGVAGFNEAFLSAMELARYSLA